MRGWECVFCSPWWHSWCLSVALPSHSILKCLCTHRRVGTMHRFMLHKCTSGSLCGLCAAYWALHFELSFLVKLVSLKPSGALRKGRVFKNCILCTCEAFGCIETIWKEMLLHPTAEGCPQGNKANQRHQQPSNKSKRNQSLSAPRRSWVLKTEEELPWGTRCVQLAYLCPHLREQESKSKNTESWKTMYDLEHRGTTLELSFTPTPFFPNFVPKRKVDNI